MTDNGLNEIIAALMAFRYACLKHGLNAPLKIVLDPYSMDVLKCHADIQGHLVWRDESVKTSLLGIEFTNG